VKYCVFFSENGTDQQHANNKTRIKIVFSRNPVSARLTDVLIYSAVYTSNKAF